jgi:hypothetical protein
MPRAGTPLSAYCESTRSRAGEAKGSHRLARGRKCSRAAIFWGPPWGPFYPRRVTVASRLRLILALLIAILHEWRFRLWPAQIQSRQTTSVHINWEHRLTGRFMVLFAPTYVHETGLGADEWQALHGGRHFHCRGFQKLDYMSS